MSSTVYIAKEMDSDLFHFSSEGSPQKLHKCLLIKYLWTVEIKDKTKIAFQYCHCHSSGGTYIQACHQ